jgi:3-hydroxyisobutyrate dehydrogenase
MGLSGELSARSQVIAKANGEEEPVRRVRPLLDAMASSAPMVGTHPGDGQKVKLVNQILCGVHIAVAGEALAFAEAMGLDARTCWEVLRAAAAASFMLEDRGERMVDGEFENVKSALEIFVKDMGLVTDAAHTSGFQAPLAAAAQQLYLAGRDAGFGELDDSSVINVLRRDSRLVPTATDSRTVRASSVVVRAVVKRLSSRWP